MSKKKKVFIPYILIWLNCSIGMHVFSTAMPSTTSNKTVRIVNGYRCPIEDHPYMVSLRRDDNFKHYCRGTLFAEFWILTAAHCCRFGYNSTAVFGRSIVTNGTTENNSRTIIHRYMHPDSWDHDICLMQVNKPILQSKNVRYVQLANYLHMNTPMEVVCKESIAMGWGTQRSKDLDGNPVGGPVPYDPHLRCVNLSILAKETCEKRLVFPLDPSVFCAYAKDKGVCQGDPGGPLMCNDVQYGITIVGVGCAYQEYPVIFTRVNMYEDFIRATVKKAGKRTGGSSHMNTSLHFLLILLYIILVMLEII